jgi:hypothetical protein
MIIHIFSVFHTIMFMSLYIAMKKNVLHDLPSKIIISYGR